MQWLSSVDDRAPNIGQGRPRPTPREVFIKPFSFDIAANQLIPENATSEGAFAEHTAKVGALVSGAIGTDERLDIPRFRAARAVFVTVTTSPTVATSNRTGLKYLKYSGPGDTVSIPFGRGNDATLDERDARNEIKGRTYPGGVIPATLRLSFRPEKG
jgi:hypothetical protein